MAFYRLLTSHEAANSHAGADNNRMSNESARERIQLLHA